MSTFGKAFIAGVMIFAPSIGLVAVAEAQPPIRIGASVAQTGLYAAPGQNQLRGYDGVQLAHKSLPFQWQDGKKVIVWPEELAPNQPRFPTPPWSQRP